MSVKKKAPARKAAKPKSAAPKRKTAASKPAAAKPKVKAARLGLVPKAKRAAPPARRAFAQAEGASSKQVLVFQLIKARARVLAYFEANGTDP